MNYSSRPVLSDAVKGILRRTAIIGYHAALWAFSFELALQLRFDGEVAEPWASRRVSALTFLVVLRLAAFYRLGLFHGLWRYAGLPELKSLLWATTLPSFVWFLARFVPALQMPRTTYVGEWLASVVLVGGSRFAIRMLRERRTTNRHPDAVNTLIVGAGDTGESLLRDVQRTTGCPWTVRGFLDDNHLKAGALLRGIPVLGPTDDATLSRFIRDLEIQLVVLAIPTADGNRLRQIMSVCRKFGIKTKTMPGLAERIENQLPLAALREIRIEDLLRRDPIELDTKQVAAFIQGRTILVTGGAGSIGSELARQVLRFHPRRLVLLDHNENGLFYVERELRALVPNATIEAAIGDMTDRGRVEAVFRRFRPAVVFHAAAHKHVPMMEVNPTEAVKNNIFGTQLIAEAAHNFGCHAFVMVSTDKAVNPTSIMGATKRIAEMVIQARATTSTTRYVAVRFGNVLGSAGSVVPIFREQIARGGPITVTHPEMRRYFMTIPEASQLVLQAGALGKGGEIFVLDMGEPVKVVDLATDLIQLSGLRPNLDIELEFTGIRPGEKLFEELLYNHEAFDKTSHPKIVVGRFRAASAESVNEHVATLRAHVAAGDEGAIRQMVSRMLPEAKLSMHPPAIGTVAEATVSERKDGEDDPVGTSQRMVQPA